MYKGYTTKQIQGLLSVNDGTDPDIYSFDEVKNKIVDFLKEKGDNRLTALSFSFAKYDWHGCPSNWSKNHDFNHEDYIYKWATYALKTMSEDRYNKIISEYNEGLVPDVFHEFIDYD